MSKRDMTHIKSEFDFSAEDFDRVKESLERKSKAVLLGEYDFSPVELLVMSVIAYAKVEAGE
jgi:hypothetical protein